MEKYEHFATIVADEHPYSLIENYKDKDFGDKYIKYYYKDAAVMKAQHLQLAKAYLDNVDTEFEKLELEDIIETLESQTIEEFWEDLSENYETDDDKNIITYENPIARLKTYELGDKLSMPFILKNGEKAFQARKSEIDWEKIHLFDYNLYKRAWEIVMEGDTPCNDNEIQIKKNMGSQYEYFKFFKDKATYATHCSSFWAYAFLSENTDWQELSYERNQIEWVNTFYDTYIKPLPEDTLLTIFECKR